MPHVASQHHLASILFANQKLLPESTSYALSPLPTPPNGKLCAGWKSQIPSTAGRAKQTVLGRFGSALVIFKILFGKFHIYANNITTPRPVLRLLRVCAAVLSRKRSSTEYIPYSQRVLNPHESSNTFGVLTSEDLQTRRRQWEAKSRPGNTATEACIKELEDNGELHRPFLNSHRQLIGLVYTTPTARALLRRFPTVIFIDCTYKTNRYRMPMLHLVGFACTNQTFTAGIALILRETTDWYDVAIEAFLSLTTSQKAISRW